MMLSVQRHLVAFVYNNFWCFCGRSEFQLYYDSNSVFHEMTVFTFCEIVFYFTRLSIVMNCAI